MSGGAAAHRRAHFHATVATSVPDVAEAGLRGMRALRYATRPGRAPGGTPEARRFQIMNGSEIVLRRRAVLPGGVERLRATPPVTAGWGGAVRGAGRTGAAAMRRGFVA